MKIKLATIVQNKLLTFEVKRPRRRNYSGFAALDTQLWQASCRALNIPNDMEVRFRGWP